MKTKMEFEKTCSQMMEDRWSCNIMPELPTKVEKMFYENFGMSAQEMNEVFSGRMQMD